MKSSRALSRASLRRSAALVGIAGTALLSVAVVQQLTSAAPGDIELNMPGRVYTFVNTDLAFTGTDAVSGDNRLISVGSAVEDPAGTCDTSASNNYSILYCPRVQLDLTTTNGAGLLSIPGITLEDPDNNAGTDNSVLVAPSGAVVDQSTEPDGSDGLVFHLNGTQTQLNDALATLKFVPSADYEERETSEASLPNLKIIAVQGDDSSSVTKYVYIKVEDPNDAPSTSVPAFPVDIAAGSSDNAIAGVSVVDDDMCNLTICGGSYTNPGQHETDDEMLLVMWLPDSACGTFYTGSAAFSTKGGGVVTSVAGMLTAEGLSSTVLDSVTFGAQGLDLSTQPASVLDATQVYAGIGSLSEVRYALSSLKYNAPAGDMTCYLNIEVNDLGHNGMPTGFSGGSEVPNAKGDTNTVELHVFDAHPDVSIYQLVPGSLGDPAGPNDEAQFTIEFDQEIEESSFTIADIDTSGSTATGVALHSLLSNGDGKTFSVQATATSDGTIVASIPAGGVFAAGHDGDTDYDNEASAGGDNEITWDQTNPSVGVGFFVSPPDPVTASPIEFKVTVADDHIDPAGQLTNGDLELGGTAGATLAVITATGDPSEFKVSVSGMTQDGDVTLKVKAGAFVDDADNLSDVSGIAGVNWDQPAVDNINPNVTVAKDSGQSDPGYGSSVAFTVTFDEHVIDFEDVDVSDVTIGGTAGPTTFAIAGGPLVYTVTVSGMTQSGTVTLAVPVSVAVDGNANPNNASLTTASVDYVFDNTNPTVTVNQAVGQDDPASTSPIVFDVVFSEPITGFTTGDLDISSGAGSVSANIFNSGDDTNFTVEISGMSQDGDVTVSVVVSGASDPTGNTSDASTSTDNTVTWVQPADTTNPTVTVEKAAGQGDPTSASPIVFDVVFSEPISGFDTGDLSITSTAGSLTASITNSGDDMNFTVELTGMSQDGDVTLSIPANGVSDAGPNGNEASTSTDDTVAYLQSSSSLSQSTPGGTVSITATGGDLTSFNWAAASPAPPAGWDFPYGMLTFSATTTPGSVVTFTLTLPAPAADYMKLNGTWSSFTWDGETGAQISGNTITVAIKDNGRGDGNATAGLVTDPGAPAVEVIDDGDGDGDGDGDDGDGDGSGGGIPDTGAASELPLQIGTVLVLIGCSLWLASRPRRRTT